MQYKILTSGQTRRYSDATAKFRLRNDGDALRVDKALTATGFDGDENTDWESLVPYESEEVGAIGLFRIGVRDLAFRFDQTLTATGFAGTENTDWENLATFKKEE